MEWSVRPARPEEWRKSRDLRLEALRDPVADFAFARSYAEESLFGDDQWIKRAASRGSQQFVGVVNGPARAGEAEAEEFAAMAVVVPERPGYYCLNGVYVRPGLRGSGVADALLAAAAAWAWERADRLHLWVHERNPRAEAVYRRHGFARTGRTMAFERDPAATEFELALPKP
ncbi:GNAT family N-acetyltransferase [Actinacidiphila yeochonensis]|uniref:GNAT family N-acetyltransferase n=1 Tax=Actinacidiphila yeochonensis TaxID=89050 RepID=UPI0005652996|nr:GNAT family N-acetyltransferase [Actinacidiphila yeochonensis]